MAIIKCRTKIKFIRKAISLLLSERNLCEVFAKNTNGNYIIIIKCVFIYTKGFILPRRTITIFFLIVVKIFTKNCRFEMFTHLKIEHLAKTLWWRLDLKHRKKKNERKSVWAFPSVSKCYAITHKSIFYLCASYILFESVSSIFNATMLWCTFNEEYLIVCCQMLTLQKCISLWGKNSSAFFLYYILMWSLVW